MAAIRIADHDWLTAHNGTPAAGYALNEAAWLDVAPDDYDMTDPENPVAIRHTTWRDIHKWAGWGDKHAG